MTEAELKAEKKRLKKEKKRQKKEKKSRKRKDREDTDTPIDIDKGTSRPTDEPEPEPKVKRSKKEVVQVSSASDHTATATDTEANKNGKSKFSFPIQHILAPMVGASELPFRLLCRKYGAQLCYTPMMSSAKFSSDHSYRKDEFQTIPEDRPLVCHFSANDPEEFAKAAKLVEDKCDAIDLNLGCPQRTAYVGHFGSYLLEQKDRDLICNIVKKASKEVSKPIFVKIRLLNTIKETIKLCRDLKNAGASLIAIHARYRASFERKGAGARDGAAMLDQIVEVKKALGPDFPIIANGNVITYDDVVNNMEISSADGIMSAEGILDNPALFLPRHGNDRKASIEIAVPAGLPSAKPGADQKKKRKLAKKLREIETIEAKAKTSSHLLTKEQKEKIATKDTIANVIAQMERDESTKNSSSAPNVTNVPLKDLLEIADDKTSMANEYLDLASTYPTTMRTTIFHTRRILKIELGEYQLMEECTASKSIDDIRDVIAKVVKYQNDPASFTFDLAKAKKDKVALAKKKLEEGKRKRYEGRMMRKAKREGRSDLEYYLRQGAAVPTVEEIDMLCSLSYEGQLKAWKANDHSQHCMGYHLEEGGCKRDRACAFLHVDAIGKNTFHETDEVAG